MTAMAPGADGAGGAAMRAGRVVDSQPRHHLSIQILLAASVFECQLANLNIGRQLSAEPGSLSTQGRLDPAYFVRGTRRKRGACLSHRRLIYMEDFYELFVSPLKVQLGLDAGLEHRVVRVLQGLRVPNKGQTLGFLLLLHGGGARASTRSLATYCPLEFIHSVQR